MKKTCKRIISFFLCAILITGTFPLTAFAAHRCPECGEQIDGELYCHECYCCFDCCLEDICQNCERCIDCSGATMCIGGCGTCDECAAVCATCGLCEDCSGYEICDTCTRETGEVICIGCAIAEGFHCPDCGECYYELGDWCITCGLCFQCADRCDSCSDVIGESICVECAIEQGYHCPSCGECCFEVGEWCDSCGRCCDCVEICDGCSGVVVKESICVECAIEQGYHCPQCDGCYEENGAHCSECGQCENCATICTDCVPEGICMDCAVEKGLHCGGCFACSADVAICDGCGWQCEACADDFCEYCNLCSICATTCPNCGHCSECADLCPECGEYCSECSDFCDDCGLCAECCKARAEEAGCDCDDWVCIQNSDWENHYEELHSGESSAHTVKPSARWSFNANYHWHPCCYCSDSAHYTSYAQHTFDEDGKCTDCGYDKNAKIQITQQPQDVTGVHVTDANSAEAIYKANTVHFAVKAQGNSALTYKWYRGHYNSSGELCETYLNPVGEYYDTVDYEGPEITDIIPTDACSSPVYYFCVISDQDGNTVTTNLAEVFAKHYYLNASYKNVCEKTEAGHKLYCVGEDCEEVTTLQKHYDDNDDYICDACGWEMKHVLKQIDIRYDDVYAAFRVGESVADFSERLTNACRVSTFTSHANAANDSTLTSLYHSTTGKWDNFEKCSAEATVNSDDLYAVRLHIACTMKDDTTLPAIDALAESGILCWNGVPLKSGEDFNISSKSYQMTTNANGQSVYHFDINVKLVPKNESAYNITVKNGEAVSVVNPNSITKAFAGQTVNLSTELDKAPNEGDVFSHWECTSGDVTIRNSKSMYDATFVMPDSDVAFEAVFTHVIPALTGNATVSGATNFGETLTAVLNDGNNSGVLSYQWLRNSEAIFGATNSTYRLSASDVGKNIAVSITDLNHTGAITSARYLIAKATAPAAPTELAVCACTTPLQNDGKITGVTSTMEYKKYNAVSWTNCTDTTITDLTPGNYYVRYKETETCEASEIKVLTVTKYAVTFYATRSGNTVTVTVCNLPANCTVFVGEYNLSSQMVGIHSQTCTPYFKKSYTFTVSSAASKVACFLTADGFVPLTESITPTTV